MAVRGELQFSAAWHRILVTVAVPIMGFTLAATTLVGAPAPLRKALAALFLSCVFVVRTGIKFGKIYVGDDESDMDDDIGAGGGSSDDPELRELMESVRREARRGKGVD